MADEKDESGSSGKEFFKDIKLLLYERLSNPLLGSFVVSWIVFNHRLLAVLFSGIEVEKRFKFIDESLYSNIWSAWWHWLVGPLCFAFGYVFGYPHLAKWINGYWLPQQNKLKKQRDDIDGATLLTKEESEKIRKEAGRWVRDVEADNLRLRDQLQALAKATSEDDKPKAAAQPANDPYVNQRRYIEQQQIESETIEAELKLKEARDRRNQANAGSPNDPLNQLPEGTKKLMKFIGELGGKVSDERVIDFFKNENIVKVHFYIDRAVESELIEKGRDDSGQPSLNLIARGRKYLATRNLI